MWIFSIGFCKCQILRKNQTGVGVLDNNTTHTHTNTNTNTNTYLKKSIYVFCILIQYTRRLASWFENSGLFPRRDRRRLRNLLTPLLSATRRRNFSKIWDSSRPHFLLIKMGEKRNRKTNVGDATMVLKFCFWFESSIRAEQSKRFFCVSGVWSFRIVVVDLVISTPELCFFFVVI